MMNPSITLLHINYETRIKSDYCHDIPLSSQYIIFFFFGRECLVMMPDKCTSTAAEAAESEQRVNVMTDEDRTTFRRDSASFSSEKLIICEITVCGARERQR